MSEKKEKNEKKENKTKQKKKTSVIGPSRLLLTRHYKNTPIQIYWKFHLQKLKIFR